MPKPDFVSQLDPTRKTKNVQKQLMRLFQVLLDNAPKEKKQIIASIRAQIEIHLKDIN